MLDSLIEAMSNVTALLVSIAFTFYNKLTGMAVEMLGQNPVSWNSSGWSFVEGVNTVFIGIGSMLVVIFFLFGFCSDSLDIRQDFRLENILRMFIKLNVAEFFVINSLKMVKTFFLWGTGIIRKISGRTLSFQYSVPGQVEEILIKPSEHGVTGIGGACMLVLLLILAMVFFLMVSGCGMMILYEAFQRFFKILLLVPYGALANSTMAGNHMLNHSAESFWKYAFGTILEAVTMYMALVLSSAVLTSGMISLSENETGVVYVIGWILESSFICMLTLGSIKGASAITQRALGL